jgi:hypothetical protein
MGVPWTDVGDGRPNLSGEGAYNARLCAPAHLTQPLEGIATAAALAVIIDVDALTLPMLPNGDRALALAFGALSHVGAQVVVVAKTATDRRGALQRSIPRSCWRETESAVPRLREQTPDVRIIAITNDAHLLAALGPEDRGLTLAGAADTSQGILPGEVSMRAVLWWIVSLRAAAGLERRR